MGETDAAEVARDAAALYDEVHAAVSAEPVGSLARRLHSALGDLAHAVLTAPDPAAAEARGAERALREAADEIDADLKAGRNPDIGWVGRDWLRARAAQVACVDPSSGESGSTDPEVRQSADRTSSPSRVPGEGL